MGRTLDEMWPQREEEKKPEEHPYAKLIVRDRLYTRTGNLEVITESSATPTKKGTSRTTVLVGGEKVRVRRAQMVSYDEVHRMHTAAVGARGMIKRAESGA